MGRKLYPPYIDGKIPAFCGTTLRVPFRHNRAVGKTQYSAISCKIKTVSTNEWKWTIQSGADDIQQDIVSGNWYVDFNLAQINPATEDKTYVESLCVGLYYKIQIAYVDTDGVVGYFSDVGVVKYTSVPTVSIEGLYAGINGSKFNYVGTYSQKGVNKDITEKVYSYKFTIIDEDGKTFLESGEQIHNSSLDVDSEESKDTFKCNKEMVANKKYRIRYSIVTINGLEYSSPIYYIVRKDTIRPSVDVQIHAEPNFDNGYIRIYLSSEENTLCSGNFSICRASALDNFQTWNQVYAFSLTKESPIKDLFYDFTVEQGVDYCYSLQQYNASDLYSTRILSETVTADFEDMFLYDGERQLKIRFNPNVSSFKNDILESKMDTIGGRYPFIFRNGNVKYKEFPITGLISYLMDEQEFFIDLKQLKKKEEWTTDLTSDNVRAERIFKLEVMDWLSNGEAKLFRSPTEGNYLVRLLNSSLSPNAPTGRMLHTFTATAYEIDNVEFETLDNYNMFRILESDSTIMNFATLNLYDSKYWTPIIDNGGNITEPPTRIQLLAALGISGSNHLVTQTQLALPLPHIYLGEFINIAPGSIIGLEYDQIDAEGVNVSFITIGRTEVYKINTKDNPVIRVYLMWTPASTNRFDGLLNYGYFVNKATDTFSQIYDLNMEDKFVQYIGKHNNIVKEDANIIFEQNSDGSENLDLLVSYNNLNKNIVGRKIFGLENIKNSIGRIYWMKIYTREIKPFYPGRMTNQAGEAEFIMYYNENKQAQYLAQEILDINIYADVTKDPVRYYDGRDLKRLLRVEWYGSNYAAFPVEVLDNSEFYWIDTTREPWNSDPADTYNVDRLYKFSINHVDRNIDLKTIRRYIITDLDNVSHISLGRMLIMELFFQNTEITYSIENDFVENDQRYSNEYELKHNYETALNNFSEIWMSQDDFSQLIQDQGGASGAAEVIDRITQKEINSLLNNLALYYNAYCNCVAERVSEIEEG